MKKKLIYKYISFVLMLTLIFSLNIYSVQADIDVKEESIETTEDEKTEVENKSEDELEKDTRVQTDIQEDIQEDIQVIEDKDKDEAEKEEEVTLEKPTGIFFDDIIYVDYGEDINKLLLEGINHIYDYIYEHYESDKDYSYLMNAMDKFVEAHTKLTDKQLSLHKDNDQFDFLFTFILLYSLDSEISDEPLIYCADNLFKALMLRKENGTLTQIVFDEYTTVAYKESDKKTGMIYQMGSKKASAAFRQAYGDSLLLLNGSPLATSFTKDYKPSEHLSAGYENYVPVHDDDFTTEYPDITPDEPELPEYYPPIKDEQEENDDESESGSFVEEILGYASSYYKKIGNDCYRVYVEYKNGQSTTSTEIVPKDYYARCGIYDYISAVGPSTYFSSYSDVIINNLYNTDKNLSDNTLQFTLDKSDGDKAYYYDTGIRVNEDSKVEYGTLKNVYKFIALNLNSFYIKDDDAVLTIIDGKPYFLNDRYEPYTKEEIGSLFDKNENVAVKIDKAKSRISSTVENQNEIQKIFYKGDEIKFTNKPIESGSVTVYPLNELSKVLGVDIQKEGDKIIIENENGNVIYYVNSTRVINNGQIKEISIKTSVKDGEIYGQLLDILIGLGFKYEVQGNDIYIK